MRKDLWTDEDIRILEKLSLKDIDRRKIAKILKRSPKAILNKSTELGIYKKGAYEKRSSSKQLKEWPKDGLFNRPGMEISDSLDRFERRTRLPHKQIGMVFGSSNCV